MVKPNILNQNRRVRKVLELRLTKLQDILQLDISEEDCKRYVLQLDTIWTEINTVQSNIEFSVDEDDLEGELEVRWRLEEIYWPIHGFLELETMKYTPNQVSTNTVCMTQNSPNIPFQPYSSEESFTNFIRRFEVFLRLRGDLKSTMKVDLLLQALPPQIHEQLYNICIPDSPLKKTYDELLDILTACMDPKLSIWARQHKFITRLQMPSESIQDYATALKKLTIDCEFNCNNCKESVSEILLRMQFIRGLNDPDIRTKLLQKQQIRPFKEVVEQAATVELAKDENYMMKHDEHRNEVHKMTMKTNDSSASVQVRSASKNQSKHQLTFESLHNKCYRCGESSHKAHQCKFKTFACNFCKKTGHLARVCLKRTRQDIKQTEENTDLILENEPYDINILQSGENDKFMIQVTLETRPLIMELDTGAALSVISFTTFNSLNIEKKLFKTGVQLKTYTGEIIKPRGVCFVKVSYRNKYFVGKLYVVNQEVDSIFGRDWIREVELDPADIRSVKESTDQTPELSKLLSDYSDIFHTEIGKVPNEQGHFNLIEGTQPIFIKPRQVPYALKDKVEKELNRLEHLGIITPVESSDWGTPIVPVVKPTGDVRICADFKVTLNKVIKDEHYPIPRIDDIFTKMNGGKLFCSLDVSNAYLHLEMDKDSADMQTLSTHKGLYRVNRLMFGVKVAPSIWQRFMDKTLHSLEGVQCFFDDIIVQGATKEQLLQRLTQVFERIRNKNLKLNRDKCNFFKTKIEYLGHVIDSQGLHKSDSKVKSILKAKRPENVTELRTFLGLTNYYNKFIKDLATILHPLNLLLQKGNTYSWSKECENSFRQIKQIITSDDVLVHFDPSLPLTIATDASPVGLGAVISHRYEDGSDRPIAYASRTLTKAERKYSQIDKEALAIYWGLKKFFSYCYGRRFTIITDHKPLVSIFNPSKTLPTISATRIFNYAHFLSGFNYDIEYRKTTHHGNADYLSRFPSELYQDNLLDAISVFQINQVDTLNLTSKLIANETRTDRTLGPLLEALQNGLSVETYGYHDNELTIQDGCILKGWRVLIPDSLVRNVLRELHVGHIGLTKMKALARSFCSWRRMEQDIEELVVSCRQCIEKQNVPPQTIHPWEHPTGAWERIHVDYAGPTDGQQYLIVVDAFTKWVEVIPTRTATASWTVQELRKIFSTFGFPHVLVSDNGRQFVSNEFQDFIRSCNIIHKTTAPYHPSSNGQVERNVQTIKKALTAMSAEKGTLQYKLYRLLMQLRQSPNSTGTSSYHLMFGREIRTNLSILQPEVKDSPIDNNIVGVRRLLKVGDRVQARNYINGKGKWSLGTVISREGTVTYTVKMDDGQVWKRHIDQLIKCKIPAPN